MDYILIAIVAAMVFGLCWLIDKAFTKLFRSQAQHMSGKSIRLNKRFATTGVVLTFLSLAVLIGNIGKNTTLTICCCVILVVGIGLVVYYLSTGIFYDDDTFLYSSFGRKSLAYRYADILHQQLYVVQGGSYIVELHMRDGSAVQVLSQMPDYGKFLHHARERWCHQRGLDPDTAPYDPDHCVWFPEKEA